jgi:hypothetical protein
LDGNGQPPNGNAPSNIRARRPTQKKQPIAHKIDVALQEFPAADDSRRVDRGRSAPARRSGSQIMTANTRAKYWHSMTLEEQHGAIRELSASGFGNYAISVATGLSIEQIIAVLTEPAKQADENVA